MKLFADEEAIETGRNRRVIACAISVKLFADEEAIETSIQADISSPSSKPVKLFADEEAIETLHDLRRHQVRANDPCETVR